MVFSFLGTPFWHACCFLLDGGLCRVKVVRIDGRDRIAVLFLVWLFGIVCIPLADEAGRETTERRLIGGKPEFAWEHLPPSRLRRHIEALTPDARQQAEQWLRGFSFPPEDLDHLNVDRNGGIFYVDSFPLPEVDGSESTGETSETSAALPVAPFPTNLHFHSKPGSVNILYLDFDGESVTGTAWNDSLGRDPIPAVAFSSDSDYTTFSDSERTTIERIWQRVAEDYAQFDIDVTTERPSTFDRRTAHALITRNTDANGLANPSSGGGGVAYVNVFGSRNYAYYRPAWVYANNLSARESYVAEAASHEIGHNMGLSHDGKTDGTTYYSGHGSGDTSWAPIMGTGYYRNVTQWSRGEYYLANNTEDDIAIIAGKLQHRTDDHGDTPAGAAYLTITDGNKIVSTTPETDPDNAFPDNKGIIETVDDVDIHSFATGAGQIQITVEPWISPASYRGGNLDVSITLLDAAGVIVAEADPPSTTSASLTLTVAEGQYYLRIAGTGTGDPYSSTPSGYTAYASEGQYFVSGSLVGSTGLVVRPQAEVSVTDVVTSGQTSHGFEVTYSDDVAVDVSTVDSADIRVTGPSVFDAAASFVSIDNATDGSPRVASYAVPAPGGAWDATDNGTYEIFVLSNAVGDTEGAFVDAQKLGEFTCGIAAAIYRADLNSAPGWSLEGDWAYGQPLGNAGDPSSGYDGSNVIGYNLSGTYPKRASAAYATTPAIDCSSSTESVVLRFKRWLGIKSGDSALVQVSTNGSTWTEAWSAGGEVADTRWSSVQYDITATAGGQSTVYVRWGLSSNPDNRLSYGWNLDNIELLGSGGMLDTQPPEADLNAPDLREGGNPNYLFTVVYTDNVAVATSSLGDTNLYVLGPGAYSNAAEFAAVNDLSDGTPRTASYTIPAPGGSWDETDNGDYQVFLRYNQVFDTSGNPAPTGNLGTIRVDIAPQWQLTAAVNDAKCGSVSPSGGTYMDGTLVDLTAAPSNYYGFTRWDGDLSGTNVSAQLLMDTNKTVQALFDEIVTTNYATPHWWLAQYGFTNAFELAAASSGANGMAYWESYVAGLNPDDPDDVFAITNFAIMTNALLEITWPSVSGHVYSLSRSTDLTVPFRPVPGATDVTWPTRSFTEPITNVTVFYRITVSRKNE